MCKRILPLLLGAAILALSGCKGSEAGSDASVNETEEVSFDESDSISWQESGAVSQDESEDEEAYVLTEEDAFTEDDPAYEEVSEEAGETESEAEAALPEGVQQLVDARAAARKAKDCLLPRHERADGDRMAGDRREFVLFPGGRRFGCRRSRSCHVLLPAEW